MFNLEAYRKALAKFVILDEQATFQNS